MSACYDRGRGWMTFGHCHTGHGVANTNIPVRNETVRSGVRLRRRLVGNETVSVPNNSGVAALLAAPFS